MLFGGVVTSGHPANRPPGSATACQDFRVMPGNWPRLRSGRKARTFCPSGAAWRQIFCTLNVNSHPLVQYDDGTTVSWREFEPDTYTLFGPPFSVEYVSKAYDGGLASQGPVAICDVRDKTVFYNGLGVRATDSRPPFTVSSGLLNKRFFGLDAYCPSGNPAAAYVAGTGYNQVLTKVDIYVGLRNKVSEHYSNGVWVGTIASPATGGTITVSSLSKLVPAFHDSTEQDELEYVFYATIDGGAIPYLILNSALDGPLAATVTSTSQSLSVADDTVNGWVLDLTAEMPTENFPPRPMKCLAFVDGRLYGILADGGSGNAVSQPLPDGSGGQDFTYTPPGRYLAGVVYSSAGSDAVAASWPGNPEESWPLDHFSPTPTSEIPLLLAPAPDGKRVVVLAYKHSFIIEEDADGLHEWLTISDIHGLVNAQAYQKTPYGSVWVTQRNQIVRLAAGSNSVDILSSPYQSLLNGKTVRFAHYILDPINEVDQFRVYLSDGTSVIHDFSLGGAGYTASNQDYYCAGTLVDHEQQQHHFAAKRHAYTEEGQPGGVGTGLADGLVPTADEDFGSSALVVNTTEITGSWVGQWNEFGDESLRKQIPFVDAVADENLEVSWYADREKVCDSNRKICTREKTPQSSTDGKWRFKLQQGSRFLYKFALSLTGRSSDQAYYTPPTQEADLEKNWYGSVAKFIVTVSSSGSNRP